MRQAAIAVRTIRAVIVAMPHKRPARAERIEDLPVEHVVDVHDVRRERSRGVDDGSCSRANGTTAKPIPAGNAGASGATVATHMLTS